MSIDISWDISFDISYHISYNMSYIKYETLPKRRLEMGQSICMYWNTLICRIMSEQLLDRLINVDPLMGQLMDVLIFMLMDPFDRSVW